MILDLTSRCEVGSILRYFWGRALVWSCLVPVAQGPEAWADEGNVGPRAPVNVRLHHIEVVSLCLWLTMSFKWCSGCVFGTRRSDAQASVGCFVEWQSARHEPFFF